MSRLLADAREVLFFVEDHAEAEAQAHALTRDAELLGVAPAEHAAHVFEWVEAIFVSGDDTDRDHETLLRMQEGAALVIVGA